MKSIINEFFNKRFWKYFIIITLIMIVLSMISMGNKYFERFFTYEIPFAHALKSTFISSLTLIPNSIIFAATIATFVVFRKTALKGFSNFFKLFAVGLIFILPLAIGLYHYNWNIQPTVKNKAMDIYWNLKTYSLEPEEIESLTKEKPWRFEKPNFEEMVASVMPKAKLRHKLDSLQKERNNQTLECDKYLSALPAKMAEEAYESYKLEQMGVQYQYATTASTNLDSLNYIQHQLLYSESYKLSETILERVQYSVESYQRGMNTISLLLSYITFAALGYFLRSKKMTKIAGAIAIVIVAAYFLYAIPSMITSYVGEFLGHTK